VVVSKTFTTAETMLNAQILKEWIVCSLGLGLVPENIFSPVIPTYCDLSSKKCSFRPQVVAKHMIADSTNLKILMDLLFSTQVLLNLFCVKMDGI
jgi:hypothetical protein